MSRTIANKKLKWGVFTSPQSGANEFEMHIIETESDLDAYLRAYPTIKKNPFKIINSWLNCLNNNDIILLTNPHHIHGMPSWCTENTTGSTHPSSHNRVRIGELIK